VCDCTVSDGRHHPLDRDVSSPRTGGEEEELRMPAAQRDERDDD
jgi:hypothetical protein